MMRCSYRQVFAAAVVMAMACALAGGSLAAAPAKPSIASFAPSSGKVGAKVTITGKNLSATETVRFGGVTAVFKVASATKVTAIVPQKGKTGKITLTTVVAPGPTNYAKSATGFTITK